LPNHHIGIYAPQASATHCQAFENPMETKKEHAKEKYFVSICCSSLAKREQIKYINNTNGALLRQPD